MELKEYLKIFRQKFGLFAGIIAAVVLGSFIYFSLRPITYNTSLTLNITRSGSQNSTDYRYDDFYRLQADEKFADTVVQWLKSPRIVADIYKESGLDASLISLRELTKVFRAEKLSSQIVNVTFSAKNPKTAKKISDAIYREISKSTESLNIEQKQTNWFKIVAAEPVTILNSVGSLIILFASLLLGTFIAFWVVLIVHYLD